MKRLTVDTDLPFCDIAKCDFIPGGSFCEDGSCDQRHCYEKLREYERSELEPETLRKAQELLKELNCFPVFLEEEVLRSHYYGFCKKVLWPVLHSSVNM